MLNKNEIIKELKNEKFIVSHAIYEYVCNLHLYDDDKINATLIEFIRKYYDEINLSKLKYSKLNKEIIECLIEISTEENEESIKEKISEILLQHYNLIKDYELDFEKITQNENNILLYKKLKHFSKKEPEQLITLYKNNIKNFYDTNDDTEVTEIIRKAIGTALTLTDGGIIELYKYFIELNEEHTDFNTILFDHMPYLVHPLCTLGVNKYSWIILESYFKNLYFMAYADECNYYFSNICNDEFVNEYLEKLKSIKESEIEDYYYDIAEYLNSPKVDEFLLKKLEKTKRRDIKVNIIRILGSKFNKDVIPYALELVREDEEMSYEDVYGSIAPLLIIENMNDDISKEIIEYVKDEPPGTLKIGSKLGPKGTDE